MTSKDTKETLTYVEGRVGRLRLNRPKSLHALTREMVRDLAEALVAWRDDPAVRLVLLDHADGRGFCAGGDVVSIMRGAKEENGAADGFFYDEYRLNHLMYTYPKSGVVFMDGIVMGGGVGIACPCRYRVVTERTVFAMPETSIGLFPDVGAGRYLSRLRGRAAQYLALTAARLDGAECMGLGLASHYIRSADVDTVKAALRDAPEKVESILAGASATPPDARLLGRIAEIDRLFASDDYEAILSALQAEGSEWAQDQLRALASKSPTACKVSLRLLVESPRHLHFIDEMRMEYGIAVRMCRGDDFAEGVRALLVDKDQTPHWNPATPEEVTPERIEFLFKPLPEHQAWTPLPPVSAGRLAPRASA